MATIIKTAEEIYNENFKGLPALITDNDLLLFYKDLIITCIEEYGNQFKKKEKKKLEIPEEAIITYNELFPNIKGGSGKRLRCNVKELEKAFQYFFKEYKDISWENIFKATELYIEEQKKDNFKWTRTSKYFCIKFKQPGQPESELIEFVERATKGDNFEDKESTGFQPKIIE